MGPGQPTVNGKKQIQEMIARLQNIPGFKLSWDPKPISINISKSGDLAYIIARNHITMNDSLGNPVTQDNKALLIWRKESDESWKEAVVLFNADPSGNK